MQRSLELLSKNPRGGGAPLFSLTPDWELIDGLSSDLLD